MMKKEYNGKTLYRRYALHNVGIAKIEEEREWSMPVMDTFDPAEIAAQVGGCSDDDANWCVEYYWADEEGEFVEGSDYGLVTTFYEKYGQEV